jgi:hypothetical protein
MAIAVAVVAGLLAGVSAWVLPRATTPAGSRVARLTIALPPEQELTALAFPSVAISPAGTHIAYVAMSDGRQQLHVRAVDSLQGRALPGTESAAMPFFSPDGQWTGFFAQGFLERVSLAAGTVQTVTDAPFGVGASWGPDGTIYFAPLGVACTAYRQMAERRLRSLGSIGREEKSATAGHSCCPEPGQ